jgi:hypothetical protein
MLAYFTLRFLPSAVEPTVAYQTLDISHLICQAGGYMRFRF